MGYLTTEIDCSACGYSGVVVHVDDVMPRDSHPRCPSCGETLPTQWDLD